MFTPLFTPLITLACSHLQFYEMSDARALSGFGLSEMLLMSLISDHPTVLDAIKQAVVWGEPTAVRTVTHPM